MKQPKCRVGDYVRWNPTNSTSMLGVVESVVYFEERDEYCYLITYTIKARKFLQEDEIVGNTGIEC